jgi:hypothetical protein
MNSEISMSEHEMNRKYVRYFSFYFIGKFSFVYRIKGYGNQAN